MANLFKVLAVVLAVLTVSASARTLLQANEERIHTAAESALPVHSLPTQVTVISGDHPESSAFQQVAAGAGKVIVAGPQAASAVASSDSLAKLGGGDGVGNALNTAAAVNALGR